MTTNKLMITPAQIRRNAFEILEPLGYLCEALRLAIEAQPDFDDSEPLKLLSSLMEIETSASVVAHADELAVHFESLLQLIEEDYIDVETRTPGDFAACSRLRGLISEESDSELFTRAGAIAHNNEELAKLLPRLCFTVETVAHLRGLERELLPLVDRVRLLMSNQPKFDKENLAAMLVPLPCERAASDDAATQCHDEQRTAKAKAEKKTDARRINPRFVECYLGEYRRAHGKNPSGKGTWAFTFPGDSTPWFVNGCVLFTTARKLAKAEAARRGHYRCVLGS